MLFASSSHLTKLGIAAAILGFTALALAFFAFSPRAEASGYAMHPVSKPAVTYWHPAPHRLFIWHPAPIHVVRPVKVVHPVVIRHPMPYSSASAYTSSHASAQAAGAHASAAAASNASASAY